MSEVTTDKTAAPQTEAKQPAALGDNDLDEISGGPHLQTWDTAFYDDHGGCDQVLVRQAKGPQNLDLDNSVR